MPTRRRAPKKFRTTRSRSGTTPEVPRDEYAQLCMHLAKVESTSARNRIDLDIQLRRIAQLQDELDTVKKALATTAFPTDSVLIPLPKPPAES